LKYLGNKKRLYEFIDKVLILDERENQKAIDLCSGTGSVSYLFRSKKIETIGVDSLYVSYLRTKNILELNKCDIEKINILDIKKQKKKGFIYNNYSDKYGVSIFKDYIAESIDGNRLYIKKLYDNNEINKKEYDFLISIIVEESDFRSNIMGSYASFYKKGWRNQALKKWDLDIKKIDIPEGPIGKSFNMDIIDFLENYNFNVDFIYMDPPYNHRQYIDNFHVLETIALYDNPNIKGKNNTRVDNNKSLLCNKKKVFEQFDTILNLSSKITNDFYLSYSTEGIVGIEDIEKIFLKYFNSCDIFMSDYRRFKTNSNTKFNTKLKEIIFHAKNNK
jgi:adenine-specific DNA-methyltransferase